MIFFFTFAGNITAVASLRNSLRARLIQGGISNLMIFGPVDTQSFYLFTN